MTLFIFTFQLISGTFFTLPRPAAVQPSTNVICAVVWGQGTNGVYSDPLPLCQTTNVSAFVYVWDGPTNSPVAITNYVVGWSAGVITNLVPGTNITTTNVGLTTTAAIQLIPLKYGLIFIQGSSNIDGAFYDLSPTPYLRITNGLSVFPWQFYRSRTENGTTNWR